MGIKRKLIFVGGIHGVGKSTICSQMCKDLGIKYLLASQMIKNYAESAQGTAKRVVDIGKNQDCLVEALNNMANKNYFYLLDGHFTLFNSGGNVQSIPVTTFRTIMPMALAVLTGYPQLIKERLLARDGINYDLEVLTEMQKMEIEHSKKVAKELDIKIHEIFTENILSHSQTKPHCFII